ncbi:hypothetical protein [Tritonibacter sp. SIMBA_163]|uniref:hypothetical protein n=1 Tax=Tritonibacter sp. SIMBA_163 TaxID=3080868 RepID=UPI003980A535
MNYRKTLIAISLVTLAAGCKEEKVSLGVYCEENVAETVKFSSALTYGIDISPPVVKGVRAFREVDLSQVPIQSESALGLLARDGNGFFYSQPCKGELCGLDEAKRVLKKCQSEPQCQIVGSYKNRTFYPIYNVDDQGGHICREGGQ